MVLSGNTVVVGKGVVAGFGSRLGWQNFVYFGVMVGKLRRNPLPSKALMRSCASFAAQDICDH